MLAIIKAWLAKYNITTHTLALIATALTTAYASSDTFHDYVNATGLSIYHALPAWLGKFILGAVVPLYLLYRPKLSTVGALMAGRAAEKKLAAAPPSASGGGKGTLPLVFATALAIGGLAALTGITGCTSASVEKAVSLIGGVLPSVQAGESTVAALLVAVDPAVGGPLEAFQPLITAGITELEKLCAQYTANPSASVFASIESTVDNLVTQGDAQLLAASKITDAKSRAQATGVIAAFDALLHVIDGYVSQTQTTAQVKAKVSARQVKLSQLAPLFTPTEKVVMARAYGVPVSYALAGGY